MFQLFIKCFMFSSSLKPAAHQRSRLVLSFNMRCSLLSPALGSLTALSLVAMKVTPRSLLLGSSYAIQAVLGRAAKQRSLIARAKSHKVHGTTLVPEPAAKRPQREVREHLWGRRREKVQDKKTFLSAADVMRNPTAWRRLTSFFDLLVSSSFGLGSGSTAQAAGFMEDTEGTWTKLQ